MFITSPVKEEPKTKTMDSDERVFATSKTWKAKKDKINISFRTHDLSAVKERYESLSRPLTVVVLFNGERRKEQRVRCCKRIAAC